MKKIIYFVFVLFLASCDSFLNLVPETEVTYDNFYEQEKTLESTVKGMFSTFRFAFSTTSSRLYRERAFPFDYVSPDFRDLQNNNVRAQCTPDASELNWNNEYRAVAMANLLIENLEKADLSEERYNFYMGQALVVRAYTMFYILRVWGDAPILEGTDAITSEPVTSWEKLADLVIDDLKKAVRILPRVDELKDSKGNLITSKQVASRGTAWAILAEVYAWKGSLNNQPELLKEGILVADSVINSGDYELAGTVNQVCEEVLHRGSRECILSLNFYDNGNEGEINQKGSCMAWACQKYPIEQKTTIKTKRTIFRINFETVENMYPDLSDERRTEYFYDLEGTKILPVSTTQNAAYIQKFRHPLPFESGSQIGKIRAYDNDDILIRLAAIYLIRAEMRLKVNDRAGAIADLNEVRKRAKAPKYSSNEDLAEAIAKERRKELFLEVSDYFDYVRNGTFRELKGEFKNLSDQDVEDGALYLPIHSDYFKKCPEGRQNKYWQGHGF